jgi:hypothetical protein
MMQLDNDFPIKMEENEDVIKRESSDLEKNIMKLWKEYALVMHFSIMKSCKDHV